MGYNAGEFTGYEYSVAFTTDIDQQFAQHFGKYSSQEDLTFAYWRPSRGKSRYTALVGKLVLPNGNERILQGNVAFTADYLTRVLDECPDGFGIAFIHSHLGPGWQGMSHDDVMAERDRLAGIVAGRTDLPLVGLTWGTDRKWSARFWLRIGRHQYERRWAATVRSVGQHLRSSFHPDLRPVPAITPTQVATRSVWGDIAQNDLARTRVGVVGLGSIGSMVAEALSRTGVQHITLIDDDIIKKRNLDRTFGAYPVDATNKTPKVEVSRRLLQASHTAAEFTALPIEKSLISKDGLEAVLDCDVIICCVDRPWPRHVLNKLAYAHLIPVIDGGVLASVNKEHLTHVDWTIHTIGPGHACLYCLDALILSDVALDRDGSLDDPDYIKGLSEQERERYEGRNVFAFSLSVAAHEVLQLVGLTSGNPRVGGIGPQRYRAYPGVMEVSDQKNCLANCDIKVLAASGVPLVAPEDMSQESSLQKVSIFTRLKNVLSLN